MSAMDRLLKAIDEAFSEEARQARLARRAQRIGEIQMSHVMTVPDWIWEKAIEISGAKNPASFIRNEWLARTAAGYKQAPPRAPSFSPQPEKPDRGRIIVATRTSLCDSCAGVIAIGDEMLIRSEPLPDQPNRKGYYHIKCIPSLTSLDMAG